MKKSYLIQGFILLLLVWCILNESFSVGVMIKGTVFSFITLFITKHTIPVVHPPFKFSSILYLLIYFIKLILHIYQSAMQAILCIIRNHHTIRRIDYECTIKNDHLICLLANSITLTPGTITIYKQKNMLTVLHLGNQHETHQSIMDDIYKTFEKLLIRSEKSC